MDLSAQALRVPCPAVLPYGPVGEGLWCALTSPRAVTMRGTSS
jgi:hypothetical protein